MIIGSLFPSHDRAGHWLKRLLDSALEGLTIAHMTNTMNYRVVPNRDPMIIYSGDYGTRAGTERVADYYRKLGWKVHIVWKMGH